MFICENCLKEKFTNDGLGRSYGRCEFCEDVKTCYDISSKYLNPKKVDNKNDWLGDILD